MLPVAPIGLAEFLLSAGQADLQAFDLAEPAFALNRKAPAARTGRQRPSASPTKIPQVHAPDRSHRFPTDETAFRDTSRHAC
jgi:hypothetical protein